VRGRADVLIPRPTTFAAPVLLPVGPQGRFAGGRPSKPVLARALPARWRLRSGLAPWWERQTPRLFRAGAIPQSSPNFGAVLFGALTPSLGARPEFRWGLPAASSSTGWPAPCLGGGAAAFGVTPNPLIIRTLRPPLIHMLRRRLFLAHSRSPVNGPLRSFGITPLSSMEQICAGRAGLRFLPVWGARSLPLRSRPPAAAVPWATRNAVFCRMVSRVSSRRPGGQSTSECLLSFLQEIVHSPVVLASRRPAGRTRQ